MQNIYLIKFMKKFKMSHLDSKEYLNTLDNYALIKRGDMHVAF